VGPSYESRENTLDLAEEFGDEDGEDLDEDEDANVEVIDHPVDRFGEDIDYVPPASLNSAVAWKQGYRDLDGSEDLKAFVSKTDERSQPFDKQVSFSLYIMHTDVAKCSTGLCSGILSNFILFHILFTQGLVACPGKRQRHGTNPVLRCHLIDLDKLSYMDVASLKRFVSADSEIMGKKLTGLCSKCQRKVARTVKRARKLGLMSHLGGFHITDKDPVHEADKFNFHQSLDNVDPVFSKTIL
jgi:small subunit ribosomal protein S18